MTHRHDRSLQVGALARVEGEGAMRIWVADGDVADVHLEIYEPPRFFEGFLRGRQFTEVPDITARICGICPVAYQMSACQAMEAACGVDVATAVATGNGHGAGTDAGRMINDLRRLIYCGEWIESHALHIYMLHAPDFLGYPSVVEMAADHRSTVERGLSIKKIGNRIMQIVGGREIHPINVRVGGFYRVPSRQELAELEEPLRRARDDALATVEWTAGFEFPDFSHDHEYLAIVEPGTYAIETGTPTTDRGFSFPVAEFHENVLEEHISHSTALHARLAGRGRYMTGPNARYTLSQQWLSPLAKQAAVAAGLGEECRNPFRSILVRGVELVYAIDEALRLIEGYRPPVVPAIPVPPRAGVGSGATEAPRGTLFHRYEITDDGAITSARIVPPTAQNQACVEDDLRRFVAARLDMDNQRLAHECEQAIRNYDPCISCSTHFLDLRIDGVRALA